MPEIPEEQFVSDNEQERIPDEETPIDGVDFNDGKDAVFPRKQAEKHFLEQYRTQDKQEAMKAAERKEQRTDETGIVQDRSKRIEAYVERLEHVFLNPDPRVRERNIELLKPIIHENTLIKEEDFPESFFEYQKQEMKRLGLGEVEFGEEDKHKEVVRIQEAQRQSLDSWIDHLTSNESHYPADIKYFAMQGILKTGSFDESTYQFGKRNEFTTASFRQIDHEALSMVMGALEATHHKGDTSGYHQGLLDLINRNKDFGSMYAEAMRYLDKEAGKDKALEITDGEWRVFNQGSDPQELVKAFAGKRAFLCLGNIGDASGYLKQGDVQVYFSNNRAGEPVWPRAAIAIKPNTGAYEMRGTYNANEDLDPEIAKTDIIKERLAVLPNGESFAQKDADMKKVTQLYTKCFTVDKKTGEKTYLDPDPTKDDLIFLYEINAPIEGFGYQRDPRIAELRAQRNPEQDMPVVFECTEEQIAHTPEDITENTQAYVGKLESGIFQKLPENLEHIYTSFPEGKIKIYRIETKSETKDQYQAQLREKNIAISDYAKDLLESPDFVPSSESIDLVRVTVKDMGFPQGATTDEIYSRREKLGLELCPPAVGPALRLSYTGGDWIAVGMKQIADRVGDPVVFSLYRLGDELKLHGRLARPTAWWYAGSRFVFRLRKKLETSES